MKTKITLSVLLVLAAVLWAKTPDPSADTSDDSDEHTFYYITIKGVIGTDVHRKLFKKWKADVLKKNPQVLILEIDSPGGDVYALKAIIEDLAKMQKDRLYTVAYVKDALSAGAVIAMACQRIYMEPQARIGAATPYRLTPEGTPDNIKEKFKSAILAGFRAAAEIGGHQIEFADAMVYDSCEYHITQKDGKPYIKSGPGDKMLTTKDRLLTMSPEQAIEAGLVNKKVGSREELFAIEGIKLENEMGGLKIWKFRQRRVASAKKQWDRLSKSLDRMLNIWESNHEKLDRSHHAGILQITRKMIRLAEAFPELDVDTGKIADLKTTEADAKDLWHKTQTRNMPKRQKRKKSGTWPKKQKRKKSRTWP